MFHVKTKTHGSGEPCHLQGGESGAADLGEEFLQERQGVGEVGGASFAFDPGGCAGGHEDAADVGEGAVVVVADEAGFSAEGCEL